MPADECRAADPEHLAQHEVEKLIEVVKRNRHRGRDALMIFLVYRHARRRCGRQDGDAVRAPL
jgi:hypothetical protein